VKTNEQRFGEGAEIVRAALDGMSPAELYLAADAIVSLADDLAAVRRSAAFKTGKRLIQTAMVWQVQFEAGTHHPTRFAMFLRDLVRDHGLSLRTVGDLVGIRNASGVKARIDALPE
jgi:hypothetical protein